MPESEKSNEGQPAPELTLDDVYNQYVQQQPTSPETTQVTQPLADQQLPELPDPNQDFDAFRAALSQRDQVLAQKLEAAEARARAVEERTQVAEANQDIDAAITKLAEGIDLPNKKLLKYYLADKYDNNAKFKDIWNSRHQNPVALEKALTALRNDVREHFSVKADPQLVENQMAMDKALQSSGTEQPEQKSVSERLMGLSAAEFAHATDLIKQGMDPFK